MSTRIGNLARLAGLSVMVLVAAACSTTGEASDSTTVTDSTIASTSAPTVTTEATTTSSAATTDSTNPTTDTSAATTVPPSQAAAADPGTVIVAADTGVWVSTPDGTSSQLIEWSSPIEFPSDAIDIAMSDTRGGIVVQPEGAAFFYNGDDAIVYWVPEGASALQQLLVPGDDQGILLEDVVAQDGGVGIYYTRTEGSLPDDSLQTLRRFDLDAKEVEELAQVGGWESGSFDISVGGEWIVASWAAEAFYGVATYDLDGALADTPANPLPDGEFDCFPGCPVAASLSPDGNQLAYAGLDDASVAITIAAVDDGSMVMTFSFPPSTWQVESMDFGNGFLAVNRIEEGSEWPLAAYVVDLSTGGIDFWEVPHNGRARLIETLPRLGGVVPFP